MDHPFPSLAEFKHIVQDMVEDIPPEFLAGLAGVFTRAEEKRSEELPGIYTLGEYIVQPPLPPHVFLYYGSFRRLFSSAGSQQLQAQIWETLTHEVRHHVETLAGAHALADADDIQLARYRRALEQRRHRRR